MRNGDDFGMRIIVCLIIFLVCFAGTAGIHRAYNNGKNDVWKQAVERGYAHETETSAGKVYMWNDAKSPNNDAKTVSN